MNLKNHIDILEKKIKEPKKGLPEEIFLLISRISPLINVDLLIKNKKKSNSFNLETKRSSLSRRVAYSRWYYKI